MRISIKFGQIYFSSITIFMFQKSKAILSQYSYNRLIEAISMIFNCFSNVYNFSKELFRRILYKFLQYQSHYFTILHVY